MEIKFGICARQKTLGQLKELILEMKNYTFQLMGMKSPACTKHMEKTLFHYLYIST